MMDIIVIVMAGNEVCKVLISIRMITKRYDTKRQKNCNFGFEVPFSSNRQDSNNDQNAPSCGYYANISVADTIENNSRTQRYLLFK